MGFLSEWTPTQKLALTCIIGVVIIIAIIAISNILFFMTDWFIKIISKIEIN